MYRFLTEKDLKNLADTKIVSQRSKKYNACQMLTFASVGSYVGHNLSACYLLSNQKMYSEVYGVDESDSRKVLSQIVICMFSGAIFGSLSAGYIANHNGRIKSLLFFEILNLKIYIQLIAQSLWALYIARFLWGFVMGASTVIANIVMVELQPIRLARTGGYLFYTFVCQFLLINVTIHYFTIEYEGFKTFMLGNGYFNYFYLLPAVVNLPRIYALIRFVRDKLESPIFTKIYEDLINAE